MLNNNKHIINWCAINNLIILHARLKCLWTSTELDIKNTQPILEVQLSFTNLLTNTQKYKISAFMSTTTTIHVHQLLMTIDSWHCFSLHNRTPKIGNIYIYVYIYINVFMFCSLLHSLFKSSHHFTLSIHVNFVCHLKDKSEIFLGKYVYIIQ